LSIEAPYSLFGRVGRRQTYRGLIHVLDIGSKKPVSLIFEERLDRQYMSIMSFDSTQKKTNIGTAHDLFGGQKITDMFQDCLILGCAEVMKVFIAASYRSF
jgi:hypothetical protein